MTPGSGKKPGNHPGLTSLSPYHQLPPVSFPIHFITKSYLVYIQDVPGKNSQSLAGRNIQPPRSQEKVENFLCSLPRPSAHLRFPLQPCGQYHVTFHISMPFCFRTISKAFPKAVSSRAVHKHSSNRKTLLLFQRKPSTRREQGWINAPAFNAGKTFLRCILHSSSKSPQRC